MILNERDIIRRLLKGDLVVTPILYPERQIGSTSIDLRLGTEFKVGRVTRYTHLEPKQKREKIKSDVTKYTEDIHLAPMEPFVLHPNEFALGSTLEYIKLPNDLAARLEGRSTWGRLGLQIHSTAGFVDPGFEGVLTFELQNVGKVPIPLYAGVRVAQICFYDCKKSAVPYTKKEGAKYAYTTMPMGSLFFDDYEYEIIRKQRG